MSSDAPVSHIVSLAASLLQAVSNLEEILLTQGVPSPSFDEDAPPLLPKDAIRVRDLAIDSAAEIQDLLQGPLDLIYRHGSVRISTIC
jgi:hypothetical protein